MNNAQPKTVLIDARTLSMPNTGVATYTLTMLKPLLELGYKVTLLTDAPLQTESPLVKQCEIVVLPGKSRIRWEQITVWKYLRKHDYDIYFVPSNYGLPQLYRGRTKLVLATLDVIPLVLPHMYLQNPKDRIKYKIQLWQSLKKADQVISITHAGAADIQRFYPFVKDILVFPIPMEIVPGKSPETRKHFYVYQGGVDARKKVDKLIEGLGILRKTHPDYKLILIGRGYDYYDSLIKELGLEDAVIKTGYISNADKFKYIREASGVIYPAVYCGYGLPMVEAIACDTPLIAGDNVILREVAGDAAVYVDPTQAQELANSLEQLLDPKVKKRLEAAMKTQAVLLQKPIDPELLRRAF